MKTDLHRRVSSLRATNAGESRVASVGAARVIVPCCKAPFDVQPLTMDGIAVARVHARSRTAATAVANRGFDLRLDIRDNQRAVRPPRPPNRMDLQPQRPRGAQSHRSA